ncbi:MAG: malonyl-CoA decarboxylase [Rhodobacter sp.]|nr:malonyl-CoA decarboxylase [Rhodobacter sp.]
MSVFADLLSTVFERRYSGAKVSDNRPLEEVVNDLLGSRGEVSGMSLARQILDRYAKFGDAEKLDFFRHLLDHMGIDPERVRETLAAYDAHPDKASYRAFLSAAEPSRQELARRLNQVPGATARLVSMRADLLRLARETPALAPIDLDFRHLFQSWFNRGFLVLRPVNWDSPATVLEKIIAYEAVHAIDSWDDLRRRLQPADRRCFAFFHPSMPDEPLIFVEVALTKGIPGSIQNVLSESRRIIDASDADTAVFYSISNCQVGLAGISFGNSLIKTVVADLTRGLPNLQTFVTLSPIPGLGAWLRETGHAAPIEPEMLRRLTARYLLTAKRSDGMPRDPVARFHLGNGAQVEAVHARADTSPKGMSQSMGAMVNYRYDIAKISQNHERFADKHQIAVSADVRQLAKQAVTKKSEA